jgi:hypothetical protein
VCSDTPETTAQRKEHVAAYLWFKGPSFSAKTKFTLRLANQLGKTDKTVIDFTVFSAVQPQPLDTFDALGSHMLVKRDVLEDETYGFKMNDKVVIEADITTHGELVTTAEKPPSFAPSETLKADFAHLLTTGAFSDVIITVPGSSNSGTCAGSGSSSGTSSSSTCSSSDAGGGGGISRVFHVHSQVLKARSSYFRAMLSLPMAESQSSKIVENEVQPAVFQEVLNYVYTDAVSEGAVEAMGEWLLLAANKYGLEALKQLCEGHLCRDLSVENAALRLVLSDQAEAEVLKEACLGFVKGKAALVMQTPGWAEVAAHQSGALALEVLQAVAGAPRPSSGKKRCSAAASETLGLSDKEAAVAAVDEMSGSALRSALAGRSLGTSGAKAELVERLKAAVQSSSDS